MTWNALGDELVNVNTYETTNRELDRLGLRFAAWIVPAADHLTIATNDEYGPGAEYLGEHRVVRNPARVTYVVDPETDSERAGAVADHAYWLSGLRLAEGAEVGTIDVRSLGLRPRRRAGRRGGGRCGVARGRIAGFDALRVAHAGSGAAACAAKRRNRLVDRERARVSARVVIDPRRARVDLPREDRSRAPRQGLTGEARAGC